MKAQTVGLVLSGGGAKGMAHIGAIRALEENGIPINYIAGTSIGAIIGGLYASGYSTDEMEALFLDPEFEGWVKGRIDRKYIYHFKQETPNSSWVGFRFDIDSSQLIPTIPVNFIVPSQMDFAFLEIFSGIEALSKHNFDSLFVPFRCIATDITNGKEIIFKDGHLKDAIRASMTFPFYFRPISIDNNMLYDGGMVNNFPTDVIYREFRPDYIIGISVSKPNKDPSDENLISVLTNMLMEKETYTLKGAPNGIVIHPDIPHTPITDFTNSKTLIQIGYSTILDSLPRIRAFVSDSVPQDEITRKRMALKEKIPDIFISEIEVKGLNKIQANYIKDEMLKSQKPISLSVFKSRYFKLISEDYISHIYPSLFINKESNTYKAVLNITKEKPFKLNFGGYISANAYTTLFLHFDYYLWQRQVINASLDAYFGRYYNSVLGSIRLTRLQRKPFDQVISLGYSRWNYFNTYRIFVGDETPSYLIHEETILNYRVTQIIKQYSRITGNITVLLTGDKYYWNNAYTREDTYDRNQVYMLRPSFVYEYSTIDFRYFATQGFRFKAKVNYFVGYEINKPGSTSPRQQTTTHFKDWFSFNGEIEKVFRVAKFYRLGISAHVAWSNLPMFESFNATKLRANHYAPTHESNMIYLPNYRDPVFMAGGISNTFFLYKRLQFRIDSYYYQPVVSILRGGLNNAYTSSLFEKRAFIAHSSLAYVTKLGPITINVSWYSNNNPNFMFNISFGYLFFNNKIF
jgi:NTE family protein